MQRTVQLQFLNPLFYARILCCRVCECVRLLLTGRTKREAELEQYLVTAARHGIDAHHLSKGDKS